MAFTTVNKSSLHMSNKLYTGNSSTNAITGVGFQPDFVWSKNREDTYNFGNRIYKKNHYLKFNLLKIILYDSFIIVSRVSHKNKK